MTQQVVFVVYTICDDFTLDGIVGVYPTLEQAERACSEIKDENLTPTIKREVVQYERL